MRQSPPRRQVLAGLAASLGGLLLPRGARATAYVPLVADPDGLLDLPAGFSYSILQSKGDVMDDGYAMPAWPDGMGLFTLRDGSLALMRNHELLPGSLEGPYPAGGAPPEAYDPTGMGAVTRLVLDAVTYAPLSSNLVLCGTHRNCSGGASSWGWLSCEEAPVAGHGYVFRCDPEASSVQPPDRLPWLGRFNHEGAAVDEATQDVYLTEDRPNGRLYRSTLVNQVRVLQAMAVPGLPRFDTGAMLANDVVPVSWVTLPGYDPPKDVLRAVAGGLGAAIVRRGEGIAALGRTIVFSATAGGPILKGQLFALDAAAGTLTCLACSTDPLALDMPDNLTFAPWGQVFFGENGTKPDLVRALTSTGDLADVALQASGTAELSGLCFAPAGDALFLNLQQEGHTVVIRGPFEATFGAL